jgi:hypothetical protein
MTNQNQGGRRISLKKRGAFYLVLLGKLAGSGRKRKDRQAAWRNGSRGLEGEEISWRVECIFELTEWIRILSATYKSWCPIFEPIFTVELPYGHNITYFKLAPDHVGSSQHKRQGNSTLNPTYIHIQHKMVCPFCTPFRLH